MNDTNILKIIKNNLIFIIVFCSLLLLYIIFLCYQIYIDSKKIEKQYVTKCPDYWNIGPKEDECIDTHQTYPKWEDGVPGGKLRKCDTPDSPQNCISFKDIVGDKAVQKCEWSKSNKISWDSIQSAC